MLEDLPQWAAAAVLVIRGFGSGGRRRLALVLRHEAGHRLLDGAHVAGCEVRQLRLPKPCRICLKRSTIGVTTQLSERNRLQAVLTAHSATHSGRRSSPSAWKPQNAATSCRVPPPQEMSSHQSRDRLSLNVV